VWDNLATSLTQNNLSAGNYTITVTDNLGCVKSQTINIPDSSYFTVNPVVNNISCFRQTTEVSILVWEIIAPFL
jgi:hypothetical protein